MSTSQKNEKTEDQSQEPITPESQIKESYFTTKTIEGPDAGNNQAVYDPQSSMSPKGLKSMHEQM